MSAPDFTPGRYAEATHGDRRFTFRVLRRTARFVTLQNIEGGEPFRALVRTMPLGDLYAEVGRTATGPLVAWPS